MRSLQEHYTSAHAVSERAAETARRILGKQLRTRALLAQNDTLEAKQSRAFLHALSFQHMYAGTVPSHVVAKRRAANKVARASRRVNRQRGR